MLIHDVPRNREGHRVTTYTLAWGRQRRRPQRAEHDTGLHRVELDAALDELADLCIAESRPRLVNIYQGTWAHGEPAPPDGFQLIWGHPERAALTWLGDDAAMAVDTLLPEWPEPIGHDQDEASPRGTRLARHRLEMRSASGRRPDDGPTNVKWVLGSRVRLAPVSG